MLYKKPTNLLTSFGGKLLASFKILVLAINSLLAQSGEDLMKGKRNLQIAARSIEIYVRYPEQITCPSAEALENTRMKKLACRD